MSSSSSIPSKAEAGEKQGHEVVAPVADFDDPNLDVEAEYLEDDSPYPEVRAAVANTDDTSIPVNTFRAWFIGILWAILIPGLNQYFFFRSHSIEVDGSIAQLISYPLLRLWARIVPRVTIFGVSLNPGPFSIKEHVIITIMADVGAGSAYATGIIAVQRVYYNQMYNFSYQWLVVMSTQLIGFSIGGIARRFLVQPQSMIWPDTLATCTLFNTLHSQQYAGMGTRGGISRSRFFTYTFLGSFCWYWLPGYAFQALSYFNWVCWIAPDHIVVNQLFGTVSGLGMSIFTFDWAQILSINSPLITPWWAQANVMFGIVLIYWIIAPILYYTNVWYSVFLPISTTQLYDNNAEGYNVSRILDDQGIFDIEKYKAYSPVFLSTTFALSYGLSFATITASLTHTLLFYGKYIWNCRTLRQERPDIHARLMAKYPQVPEWWYAIVFITMFVASIVSIEVWPTQLPVWAFLLALIIAFIYVIPLGIIQASSNTTLDINVLAEILIGYMVPGRPVAMMMFKTWGFITMARALQFTSDFKLGHYMKIPPRSMFLCQVVATIIAGTVQLGVQAWMFTNIDDMCSPDQADGFICPSTQDFGTASILWGVIGPARQFSQGQIYHGLVFFFLIGFLAPMIQYLIMLKWQDGFIRYINFPVIFSGGSKIPPATPANYVTWSVVGFIFNYVIRRRHPSWWEKYNYVLSAGLAYGVVVSAVVIFFTVIYPKHGEIGANSLAVWWGNTVSFDTADAYMFPLIPLANTDYLGPSTWS